MGASRLPTNTVAPTVRAENRNTKLSSGLDGIRLGGDPACGLLTIWRIPYEVHVNPNTPIKNATPYHHRESGDRLDGVLDIDCVLKYCSLKSINSVTRRFG